MRGLGYMPTREMVEEALDTVDENRDGEVSFPESLDLLDLLRKTDGSTKKELANLNSLFEKFDDGGDGVMDTKEIPRALEYLRCCPEESYLKVVVDALDADGSRKRTSRRRSLPCR